MSAADQNLTPNRYKIVPRVLVFAWRGEQVLLLRIRGKGRWDGRYNGLGGHVEQGETVLEAARRELLEESGLQADLHFAGSLMIDTGDNPGVGLFIFSGQAAQGEFVPGEEGDLAWIPFEKIPELPVLEDVPILLERIHERAGVPFFARSFYDSDGRLRLVFAD